VYFSGTVAQSMIGTLFDGSNKQRWVKTLGNIEWGVIFMANERISIEIMEKGQVSAILSGPDQLNDSKKTGVIIAHGAANDMNNSLIICRCRWPCDRRLHHASF
jgi:hypothetical protein